MSSQLYPIMREKFLTGQFNWLAGTLRCVLLPDSYVKDLSIEFLSDISPLSRIATSQELTGRTADGGFASSDPIAFPLLVDTRAVSMAVIFKDTGVETSSELIFFMDTVDLVSAPFVPQGFDYFIYPNEAEGGFFRL